MVQFDASAHADGLRALAAKALGAAVVAVQAGGEVAAAPPYTGAVAPETTELPVDEVLSDIHAGGLTASLDIAVVYDWVRSARGEPPSGHCEDCEAFAAAGPYTAATLPAQPRDGTTRCGDACYCEVIAREPTWDEQQVLQAMSDVVDATLGGAP